MIELPHRFHRAQALQGGHGAPFQKLSLLALLVGRERGENSLDFGLLASHVLEYA